MDPRGYPCDRRGCNRPLMSSHIFPCHVCIDRAYCSVRCRESDSGTHSRYCAISGHWAASSAATTNGMTNSSSRSSTRSSSGSASGRAGAPSNSSRGSRSVAAPPSVPASILAATHAARRGKVPQGSTRSSSTGTADSGGVEPTTTQSVVANKPHITPGGSDTAVPDNTTPDETVVAELEDHSSSDDTDTSYEGVR